MRRVDELQVSKQVSNNNDLVIAIQRIADEIFIFINVENVFKMSTNVKKAPMDVLSFALTISEVSRVHVTAVIG